MKAANFLNLLLATAVVLLCAKLHFVSPRAPSPAPAPAAAPAAAPADAPGTEPGAGPEAADRIVVDSTGLAPRVRGFGGPVPVEVEITNGAVARVSPKMPNGESPMFFEMLEEAGLWNAWNGLPVSVAATARVDAVTSATYSSKAAIANVRAALASVPGARAGGSTASSGAPSGPAAGDIALPPPSRDEMPLGRALEARATHREFSSEPLSSQELSDLLWAANGFNRPDAGKRTAPTAINRQEIDLYVCRADGAFLWDAEANVLRLVCTNDLRGLTGRMRDGADNFALVAPVALVYVIDKERQAMQDRPGDAAKYASVDCGFVGQNVYLHCAAAGLRTVFLGSLRPDEIAAALALPPTRFALFAQTVGKPAGGGAAANP